MQSISAMHRCAVLAASLLAFSRLAGAPAPAAAADWTTFGFDPQRSGNNPSETVLSASNVSSLKAHWSIDLGGPILAQPVLLSGVMFNGTPVDVVYAATLLGTVYALNAATGAIIWQTQLATVQSNCGDFGAANGFVGVIGTPTIDIAYNRVFVVSGDGNLHALDIWHGTEHPGWPAAVAGSNQRSSAHLRLRKSNAD